MTQNKIYDMDSASPKIDEDKARSNDDFLTASGLSLETM